MDLLFCLCLSFSLVTVIGLIKVSKWPSDKGDLDPVDKVMAFCMGVCVFLWTMFYHHSH